MLDIKKFKHVHCIGIGGIGLSAIAEIFHSRGYEVSGSDMKQSDMTDHLKGKGITIYIGHDEKNVKGADLVIYSAAVSAENPEIKAAKEAGCTVVSRAEALGALMHDYSVSIAVSGTHGKTTTTSMVSLILEHAHTDPTILVGGNLAEFDGNVKVGKSDLFVTEACEYMDSFLELRPRMEIILNIDSDHLDYFKDIDHIVDSFDRFVSLVPEDGYIIAYDANPFVNKVAKDAKCKVVKFGFNEHSDYFASNISFDKNGNPYFDICSGTNSGKKITSLHLSVPGEHNVSNALAAFAACATLGVEPDEIAKTLNLYTGTQRRFDIIGTTKQNVRLIDDYAHHPTEIKATLAAAKNMEHNRLWCIFQPHTYTRTNALFKEFTEAFDDADVLIMAEIYAAREKNIHKTSSKELITAIKEKQPSREAYYFSNFDEIADFVHNNAQPGDIVFTMGAGDVYKIADLLMGK